jgi:adenylate kinase
MGKIASGKGTQAKALLDYFGGTLYSNGDRVRAVATHDTPFGHKMKAVYESGVLMPEWVASYWMTHALVHEFEESRIIFEAVAKKPNEAELFHEIHQFVERPYVVFNLLVSDGVVRERSAARARDSLDSARLVEKRLDEYHTYTERSIEFFRTQGTLIEIDGEQEPERVTEQMIDYLTAPTQSI